MTFAITTQQMVADPTAFLADDIIDTLTILDDIYHNGSSSASDLSEAPISDLEYDALRLVAKAMDPSNKYFTGVGSDTRGGKIELPFEMGSLNQVEIGDIDSWVRKNKLENEKVIVSDKMDGTSALIIYGDDGLPQIAYSRGNGTEGADISRHIFKIHNVPKKVEGRLVVRAEVELTQEAFNILRTKVKSKSGNTYKNARNMVAGIMNSKTQPDVVYEYVSVIAYEVIGHDGDKLDQLQTLDDNLFQVVKHSSHMTGSDLSDEKLAAFIEMRRANTDFEIDGIVIEVNNHKKRSEMNPTRDTLNPSYSIKYKVADASNVAIATVIGVSYNISKHGYLKPQINIEPTDLVGVTIQNCTGFNAAFIYNNGIGPGAQIQITRSGDVIPFCQKVIKKSVPQMPGMVPSQRDWKWEWTTNAAGENVDAKLIEVEENETVQVNRMIDFFEKIEAPFLKEGNVKKLYDAGFVKPEEVIRDLTKAKAISILGENGKKIHAGLVDKLSNIPAYRLLGAFSNERGMGVRRFKKLQKVFGVENITSGQCFPKLIEDVDGFEKKTAEKAVRVINAFGDFLNYIDGFYKFEVEKTVGTSLEGQKICFTGFRDKDLQNAVEAAGGEIQSGVSSKTTLLVAKNPESGSGKVKKAADKGIRVISIDEMRGMV